MNSRAIRMVVHGGRDEALRVAAKSIKLFAAAGVEVVLSALEAADLLSYDPELDVRVAQDETDTAGCELVVVLGGDGTILRGAELARPARTPVLGVNLGHVGFLAESEPEDLLATVDAVITRRYTVEERLTVDVTVERGGQIVERQWALNEASLEKVRAERMIELIVEVDGRPLSRWATDGIVAATPTGSTAYAFSPAVRSSGRRSRRSCWFRSARMRCSPGRWSSRRTRPSHSNSPTSASAACSGATGAAWWTC